MTINREFQENSLLIYKGALTVNLISILGNHLRLLVNQDSKVFQRIFKIFVELTQNVYTYSAETYELSEGLQGGAGWVCVQESETAYTITTGNQIRPEDGPKLVQYCEEINSMNEEQLRKLKRDIRATAMEKDTGAHVGLIQTSIISANRLRYEVTAQPGEDNFFVISATVTKEAQD
jgi:hypothetical protein